MTDASHPCVLLVDYDQLLLKGLVRLLRPTRRRVLTASTAEAAAALLTGNEVGVIVCEPHDTRLAAFLVEARRHHPAVVRVILTGYAGMSSVIKAVNDAHPFKLLSKPWLDEELRATVRLAFEQYAVNRKRDRLITEYDGIRANTESVHAFHVLGALSHSTPPAMNAEAINDLPVGALLVMNDAIMLVNPAARRLLGALGLPVPEIGSSVAALPAALAALVSTALSAPRGQRLPHRSAINGRYDCFVQEIAAGTLIAFAPKPLS